MGARRNQQRLQEKHVENENAIRSTCVSSAFLSRAEVGKPSWLNEGVHVSMYVIVRRMYCVSVLEMPLNPQRGCPVKRQISLLTKRLFQLESRTRGSSQAKKVGSPGSECARCSSTFRVPKIPHPGQSSKEIAQLATTRTRFVSSLAPCI